MLNKLDAKNWVNDPARTEDQLRRAAVQLGITHTGPLADVKNAVLAKLNTLANDTDPSVLNPATLPAQPAPVAPKPPAPVAPAPKPATGSRPNWLIPVILIVAVLLCVAGFWAVNRNNTTSPAATPTRISTAKPTTTMQPTKAATQAPVVATKAPTNAPADAPTQAAPLATEQASQNDQAGIIAQIKQLTGKDVVWPPAKYVAGQPGFPQDCAGLCWDMSTNVMFWYGPNAGEEDISQSPEKLGDGTKSPLDRMRDGDVEYVVFANVLEAQMEVCAVPGSKLDGKLISEWLGMSEGQCGRFAIQPGWHIVEGSMNSRIAGFGVRLSASGWASMTESQILQYNKYWKIDGNTATWIGPANVEVLMTPALVSAMQDFGSLTSVIFTTTVDGKVLLCNGTVSGTKSLSSPDGGCYVFEVPSGTYTYHGEKRTSAGVSWKPAK